MGLRYFAVEYNADKDLDGVCASIFRFYDGWVVFYDTDDRIALCASLNSIKRFWEISEEDYNDGRDNGTV